MATAGEVISDPVTEQGGSLRVRLPSLSELPSHAFPTRPPTLHAEEKGSGALCSLQTARPGAGGTESCDVNIPQC